MSVLSRGFGLVFDRITNTTPFTYRDGLTMLQIITGLRDHMIAWTANLEDLSKAMRKYIDDTDAELEGMRSKIDTAVDNVHRAMAKNLVDMRGMIDGVEARLSSRIAAANERAEILNPTNGKREPMEKVVSDVYDYARIFAYFADKDDVTAKNHDERQMVARKIDTYPTPESKEIKK